MVAVEPKVIRPKASGGRIAVPWSENLEILKLCEFLRPEKFGFKATDPKWKRMVTDLLKGGITLDKLREFFKLNGMSKRFFEIFCSGTKITTGKQFIEALKRWKTSCSAFRSNPTELAQKENIIAVPLGSGSTLLSGITMRDLRLRPALDTAWKRAKAIAGDSAGTLEASSTKTKDLLASIVLTQMLKRKSEKGYGDANKVNLRDALVLARFKDAFQKFAVKDVLPSDKQLDQIIKLQARVEAFRTWAGKNDISKPDIAQFDANGTTNGTNNLDHLLNNYASKGKKWVQDFLSKNKDPRAVPTGGKAPVKGPVKGPVASIFHFQIKPVHSTLIKSMTG